jgi:metal-responsive CopG/Arc/MetJ family transcriptional regulator
MGWGVSAAAVVCWFTIINRLGVTEQLSQNQHDYHDCIITSLHEHLELIIAWKLFC